MCTKPIILDTYLNKKGLTSEKNCNFALIIRFTFLNGALGKWN